MHKYIRIDTYFVKYIKRKTNFRLFEYSQMYQFFLSYFILLNFIFTVRVINFITNKISIEHLFKKIKSIDSW